MSTLSFTKDAADDLVKAYSTPDVIAQRRATLELLDLAPGEHVIDVGSGPGFLSEDMAHAVGPEGLILGIDVSPDFVTLSSARNALANLSYAQEDALALSAKDEAFDRVVSTQVAEYIPDTSAMLEETFRVLKPGGQALVMATDWDCVAWHTADPERMKRMMQTWETHCAHSRLPRALPSAFYAAGFTDLKVNAHPIINLSFTPDNYSFGVANLIAAYNEKQGSTPADTAAWLSELAHLNEAGQYYFATTRMIFQAKKPV